LKTLSKTPLFFRAALVIAALALILTTLPACGKSPAAAITTPTASTTASAATTTPTTTPVKTTAANPPKLTMLSVTGGSVEVLKKGAADWKQAAEGMSLDAGDKIRTDALGKALITFFEGSTVELQGDTAVSLSELGINPDQSTTVKIKQELGETLSRAKKLMDTADRYEIETPAAVAAVRGTIMFVRVVIDGSTFVGNVEGKVTVTAQGSSLSLPEATHTSVTPGQPPTAPEPGATPSMPTQTATPKPATTPAPTQTTVPPTTSTSTPTLTPTTTLPPSPPLSIRIVSLQAGDVVGRTVVVSGTVSDPAVTQGTYTLNGNPGSFAVSQGAFTFSVTLADGTNIITVNVTKNGVTAQASAELVPEVR
jgi:hypothetical protein